MRKLIFISFLILLISCNFNNEERIAELFKEVNENRVSNKQAAIKASEKIISLDPMNSSAIRVLSELTFETGDFEQSLELNKKLIELNPDAYQYQAKMALLLELFDKKDESELHYKKARELLKQKEKVYWASTDTLSMATMYIQVGDSILARNLIDSIIKRKINKGFDEQTLREIQNQTHGETIRLLKSVMDSIKNSK